MAAIKETSKYGIHLI